MNRQRGTSHHIEILETRSIEAVKGEGVCVWGGGGGGGRGEQPLKSTLNSPHGDYGLWTHVGWSPFRVH